MVTLREIQEARRQSARALTDFTSVLRVIKAAAHQVETQPKGWGDW